jgi:hypothetical protein
VTHEDEEHYVRSLDQRVRTSSDDELKCLTGFFDCEALRARHAALLDALRAELARRGLRLI